MKNNHCILGITTEAMEKALQLPNDARIVAIQQPFNSPGVIQIHVEGFGVATPNYAPLMHAPRRVEVIADSVGGTIVDWKLNEWGRA